MKDFVIKASFLKHEGIIWLFLFFISFLINIYAIVAYSGQWRELVSQLHVVFLLSLVCYVILAFIRLIYFGVRMVFRKKRI